ncbi:MAG: Lrp/AsnC family transcriptional regulator [Epsilonproteobacteria bacterium]|nr:Lrp/AsnC family transcriptional regulator [Campylobacterota bacterium]
MKDEILSRIQKKFPLVPKPFEVIANELGTTEKEVLKILNEQKEAGIIRQTSAIFDTKRLGYKSSLVAFEIDKEDIDKAVEILNSHPGISHNYERNHSFNIWFTIAVEPDSILGLEKTVEVLAKVTKAKDSIILPTLKLFKINVKLNTTGKDAKKEKVHKTKHKEIELTPLHKEVIKLTQYDIDFVSEPFKKTVEELGLDYEEYFAILQELQEAGVMRRFASILNHRKAGFNANAMVVWDVAEGKEGEVIGAKAAAFSAVSHCYLRPKYPNWPYNLFTMVHGKTTEETNGIIEEMAQEIDAKDHMPLYSSREFKKVRIEYFTPAFKEWENKYKEISL